MKSAAKIHLGIIVVRFFETMSPAQPCYVPPSDNDANPGRPERRHDKDGIRLERFIGRIAGNADVASCITVFMRLSNIRPADRVVIIDDMRYRRN